MAERHGELGRWVRLSADWSFDQRIESIGVTAELLWVRTLATSRLLGSDGHLTSQQLPLVTRDMERRAVKKAIGQLVDVGLWEPCEDGWRIPYDRWARWQDTNDDREAQREGERKRKAAWRARKAAEPEND